MLVLFHKMFRPWLAVGIFGAAILGQAWIVPAAGQDPDKTVQEATLQLWPEYDDPGLLVIYSGDFTGTLRFPQQIAVPLPANARGIQATSKEADGRLTNEQWQIVNGELVYTLPGPGFHIEYYLDRPPSGDQREIGYEFKAPYATDSLDVRVQQPARATDFSLTPPPDSSVVGDDGLTYSSLRKTGLKPGDKLDLTIRYKKTDQGLTRAPLAAAQTAPRIETAPEPAPSGGFDSWLPWVLIGVGVVALTAAVVYWFVRGRESGAPAQPGRSRRSAVTGPGPGAAPKATGKGATFCTQCGQQYRPDDRFCANCGAPR
jgi:zinc-ribbon domain